MVWRYEGDYTLYDLMQKKDWPYNLEPLLFGRELNIPKGPERRWLSLRVVMKQASCACFNVGQISWQGALYRALK